MIRGLATVILVRRESLAPALLKREVHSRRFIKRVLRAPALRREREVFACMRWHLLTYTSRIAHAFRDVICGSIASTGTEKLFGAPFLIV